MRDMLRLGVLGLIIPDVLSFCVSHCGRHDVTSRLTMATKPLATEWNDKGDDVLSTRRNILLGACASVAVATAATSSSFNPSFTSINPFHTMSIAEAVKWIDDKCDRRFLHAVVASDYNFLYRGVDDSSKMSIHSDAPDLLLPGTYGSPQALDFFQSLERVMENDAVKPSNGHLATTSVGDASKWGTPASIWPMAPAHYAWFQDGGLFYPTSSNVDRKNIIVDGRDCGKESLEDALRGDSWEVMVATDSFLTVPASMDQALREALKTSFLV